MYTGATPERTDIYTQPGKHSRHYSKENKVKYRKIRSSKHRYVYFCTHDKKLKREWKKALKYNIEPYPKGDNNPDYVLGDYLKDNYIEISEK